MVLNNILTEVDCLRIYETNFSNQNQNYLKFIILIGFITMLYSQNPKAWILCKY